MHFINRSLLVLCIAFCTTRPSDDSRPTKEQVESLLEISFEPSLFGKEEETLLLTGFRYLPSKLIKEINNGAKKGKPDTNLYKKGKAVCVRVYITNQSSFERRLAALIILTKDKNDGELYIEYIVVHPEVRGLSIGTILIEKIVAHYKPSRIGLSPLASAVAFYLKNGFTPGYMYKKFEYA